MLGSRRAKDTEFRHRYTLNLINGLSSFSVDVGEDTGVQNIFHRYRCRGRNKCSMVVDTASALLLSL